MDRASESPPTAQTGQREKPLELSELRQQLADSKGPEYWRSLEELVLRQALGWPLDLDTRGTAAGVLMIPTPGAGTLRRVEGVLAAQNVPGIADLMISVREGYELVPLPEGGSYLGFVFAHADTPEEVEGALRDAHACLNIIVAPSLPVAVAQAIS